MTNSALAGGGPGNATDPPFARIVWNAYNRTGGACVAGGVYQFDVRLTSTAESTANSRNEKLPAVSDYSRGKSGAFGNFIAVAEISAALNSDGKPGAAIKYCLALAASGDNELLPVLVVGSYSPSVTLAFSNSAATSLGWTWSGPWTRLYARSTGTELALGQGNETVSGSWNLEQRSPIAVMLGSASGSISGTASTSATATYGGGILFDGWNFVSNKF